ncbi:MAG: hypothetical protein WAN02_27905, partial [Mycobacterium sp.]
PTAGEPGAPGGPSAASQPITFAGNAAETSPGTTELRPGLGGAAGKGGIGGEGARGVLRERE